MKFETVRKPVVQPIDHIKIELSVKECEELRFTLEWIACVEGRADTYLPKGYSHSQTVNRLLENLRSVR